MKKKATGIYVFSVCVLFTLSLAVGCGPKIVVNVHYDEFVRAPARTQMPRAISDTEEMQRHPEYCKIGMVYGTVLGGAGEVRYAEQTRQQMQTIAANRGGDMVVYNEPKIEPHVVIGHDRGACVEEYTVNHTMTTTTGRPFTYPVTECRRYMMEPVYGRKESYIGEVWRRDPALCPPLFKK